MKRANVWTACHVHKCAFFPISSTSAFSMRSMSMNSFEQTESMAFFRHLMEKKYFQ